jgi:hypothetical protein
MKRDAMVDKVFKDAGLPLLHIRAAYQHDTEWLENEIRVNMNNVRI